MYSPIGPLTNRFPAKELLFSDNRPGFVLAGRQSSLRWIT